MINMADEIQELKKEMEALKPLVEEKNAAKESSYKKYEKLRQDISTILKDITELKKERNSYTDTVKTLKKEKNDKIKVQKEYLAKLKEMNGKVGDAAGIKDNRGRRISPDQILKSIQRLEYSVETEALTPKKEQEMMEKIKDLRKQYDSTKGNKELMGNYTELRKKFNTINKEIEEVKGKMQQKADVSQEKHEQILKLYSDIDKLKEDLKSVEKEFKDRKADYTEVYNKLAEIKLKLRINTPSEKDKKQKKRKEQAEVKVKARAKDKKELESLQKRVMEKIKNKEKLTTDDLKILQSTDE